MASLPETGLKRCPGAERRHRRPSGRPLRADSGRLQVAAVIPAAERPGGPSTHRALAPSQPAGDPRRHRVQEPQDTQQTDMQPPDVQWTERADGAGRRTRRGCRRRAPAAPGRPRGRTLGIAAPRGRRRRRRPRRRLRARAAGTSTDDAAAAPVGRTPADPDHRGGMDLAGRPDAGAPRRARRARDGFRGGAMAGNDITITAIDGTKLSLKTEDGWTRTIDAAGATVTRDGATVPVSTLKVGDQIVFRETRNDDGTYTITAIQVVQPTVAGTVASVSGSTVTVTTVRRRQRQGRADRLDHVRRSAGQAATKDAVVAGVRIVGSRHAGQRRHADGHLGRDRAGDHRRHGQGEGHELPDAHDPRRLHRHGQGHLLDDLPGRRRHHADARRHQGRRRRDGERDQERRRLAVGHRRPRRARPATSAARAWAAGAAAGTVAVTAAGTSPAAARATRTPRRPRPPRRAARTADVRRDARGPGRPRASSCAARAAVVVRRGGSGVTRRRRLAPRSGGAAVRRRAGRPRSARGATRTRRSLPVGLDPPRRAGVRETARPARQRRPDRRPASCPGR